MQGNNAQTSPGNGVSPDEAGQDGNDFSSSGQWPVLNTAKIMMVDDEPTTIDILEVFMEQAGYARFITTTDSRQAMSLLRAERPDVLLLDLMMPEVNGFEILQAMREDTVLRRIPVVVLTSSTDAATKLRALELGATDFLAKPVDQSELVLRLRNTLAAKSYQDRLTYYDLVTGLPNRKMFLELLERTLDGVKHDGRRSAILHFGLDRFKQINDTLGHSTGDLLLTMVARRMEGCLRSTDQIGVPGVLAENRGLSRIGGDEFTSLLHGINTVEGVASAVGRIRGVLAPPFELKGEEVFVTASIGVAIFPDDGDDVDTLLKHADIALSHAKQSGRNVCQFYSAEINARSTQRLSLENRLHTAIDRDELILHYQPKVDTLTGRVIGAEALLRWQHADLGLVPPGEFIPIAEETGLIVSIGNWVLREACRQAAAWRAAGLGSIRIAVNVASQQFRVNALVKTIREALEQYDLDGDALALELTESALMEKPKACIATLKELKGLGLRLSIDDFGTGYSSLSYLRRFPLDELKIDRSFVMDIPASVDDAAIVAAIISMAHSLSLSVVAEGVETVEQLSFLRGLGCDECQGFLFSRAVPANTFADLLRRDEQLGI